MKKSVAFLSFTGLFIIMLALGMGPVAVADDEPKDAVKIPNTSILPNAKLQPVPDFIGLEWTPMSRQKRVEFKMVTDQSAAEWRCPNFYFTLRFIAVNNAFLTSRYLGNLSCHLMGMW
jgi:hypothetical protein